MGPAFEHPTKVRESDSQASVPPALSANDPMTARVQSVGL